MPAPDAFTVIAPGRVLAGRYNLLSPLARGGMAEVWVARDEVLGRSVAVKILQAHLAEDGVFVERFRREAVAAAGLSSPTIVATYDTGVDHDLPYIVMELVRGRTLRQLVSGSGPLDPPLAVAIAIQIADALADAHRAGIIHRDIKPANVLVCDDAGGGLRVKVTDFGIAKARAGLGIDLTQTGMVLGTPKYLSPEQIEGRPGVDARADLYSLGVVLFEMLTGDVPFKGTSDMATAIAHLSDEAPRASSRRPGIEPALDALVASLLAKVPSDRPPSAAATRQALEVIARHPRRPPGAGRGAAASGGPASRAATSFAGGPATGGGWARGGVSPASASGFRALTPTPDRTRPPVSRPAAVPGIGPRTPPAGGRPGSGRPSRSDRGRPSSEPPGRVAAGGRRAGRDGRRARRGASPGRRAAGTIVAAVAVAGVVVAGLLLSGRHPPGSSAAGGAPTAVGAVSASVYLDVTGHSLDNPGEAANVIDGRKAGWSTLSYTNREFGNLYSGEGLAIHLDGTHRLVAMVVTSSVAGWSASAYVSSRDWPTGTPVSAWGKATHSVTDAGPSVTIGLAGRTGDWVLLWLTRLGPSRAATINSVKVEGAA